MAQDHSLAFRGGVIQALRADRSVKDMVGARVHAEQPPANQIMTPWIRCGRISITPWEASGATGGEVSLTLHAFGGSSDDTHRLANLIVYALDERPVPLENPERGHPDPYVVELLWTGTEVMPDTASKGDYHAVIRFAGTVAVET